MSTLKQKQENSNYKILKYYNDENVKIIYIDTEFSKFTNFF